MSCWPLPERDSQLPDNATLTPSQGEVNLHTDVGRLELPALFSAIVDPLCRADKGSCSGPLCCERQQIQITSPNGRPLVTEDGGLSRAKKLCDKRTGRAEFRPLSPWQQKLSLLGDFRGMEINYPGCLQCEDKAVTSPACVGPPWLCLTAC